MGTIADSLLAYYDSKDFKDNYAACLYEDFGNDEHIIIGRIGEKFNTSNYYLQKYLPNWHRIDKAQAKEIYDLIYENFETFTKGFRSHYVGDTSLASVSFGEQEEQLEGLHNHKTGKNYKMPYLRKAFDKAGYHVNDRGYAYYDLSASGLHIDLLANKDILNSFLAENPEPDTIDIY